MSGTTASNGGRGGPAPASSAKSPASSKPPGAHATPVAPEIASPDRPTVALIGLGAMGMPMATRLLQTNLYHLVVVPHRSLGPVESLVAGGATAVGTPSDAAAISRVIITVLPDEPRVSEVLLGANGVIDAAAKGTLLIDMSTISPSASRMLAKAAAARGLSFIDAPVSGGPQRALEGKLTIMVGGSKRDLRRARPFLKHLGTRIIHAGPSGSGQLIKACNNLVAAVTLLADIEAMTIAAKAGVSVSLLRRVMLAGSAGNWQLREVVPRTVMRQEPDRLFRLDAHAQGSRHRPEPGPRDEGAVPARIAGAEPVWHRTCLGTRRR